jgi:glutamyl-tRNA reductase
VNTDISTDAVVLRQVSGSPEECTRTSCSAHAERHSSTGQSHCAFGVIGLSYHTASLDLRGRASFTGDAAKHLLDVLRKHGVSEAMVLSTCNRTEVYFAGPDHELVMSLFAAAAHADLDEIRPHLYLKKSLCAACHIFRVVSGLDSAVLGETEIVAQVKQAWKTAEEYGTCGGGLALLMQRAMEINKRVRSETELCRGVTSTAALAVQQAKSHVGSLDGRKVLVIGAGDIAARVCKELAPHRLASLTILNRTIENAAGLAKLYRGSAAGLDRLEAEMVDADVVITAATSKTALIDDAIVARVAAQRTYSQLLIDLGVPANVRFQTPRGDVEVINIDSISSKSNQNLGRRVQAIPIALDILDYEIRRLRQDLTTRTAAPTIKALVNQAEQIRQLNLAWAMEKLPELSEKERKVVEDLSNRIIKGLLQAPIQGLKHELAAAEHREIVSKLFKLEEYGDEPLAG